MQYVRTLILFQLIGPVCATISDGDSINRIVKNLLDQGCSVKLDFHGVKLVTPSFYAAVVSDLHSVFPENVLNTRFALTGMPDSHSLS